MGSQHARQNLEGDDRRRCLRNLPRTYLLFRYRKLLTFCVLWKFSRVTAAAIATVPLTIPLAKIAQNETTIAVLAESTGVIEHHPELFVLELAARFKFVKIDALQSR